MNDNQKNDHLLLIKLSKCPIEEIVNFAFSDNLGIRLIGTYIESVFEYDAAEQPEELYKMLYPSKNATFPISRFYKKIGCATIAEDLIGSFLPGPNSRTSAVVMAYWGMI